MKAFYKMQEVPWATTKENLVFMLGIANREISDLNAVATKKLARTNEALLEIYDNIGVINLTGPIFRYANLFTELSGAVSVSDLSTAFKLALDDSSVEAILFNIDSPGGEVTGTSEFADMVFNARNIKPIYAYVDGMCASAAYWIGSSASKIIANDTSILGSIGVVSVHPNPDVKNAHEVEIVSSKSPNKRPDLNTKEGKEQIQILVDNLADVFITAVARNRHITFDDVVEDFNHGGVLVGSYAVESGMADSIGTFEGAIKELKKKVKEDRNKSSDETENVTADFSIEDNLSKETDMPEVIEKVDTPVAVDSSIVIDSTANDEIVRLRSQVAKLKLDRYAAEADSWVISILSENRAFPAEKEHMISAYIQAAKDDENMGTISDKGLTRVEALKAMFAVRPSNQVTADALTGAIANVVRQRETESAKSEDLSQDNIKRLVSMTPMGQAISNK